jgi:AcrR family transcriptional regulator
VQEKSTYHHGDLRASLLSTAKNIVNSQGIEQLSLRKMAEQVGVSRTAAYHHFKDKNDLLSAIAADGFDQWHARSEKLFSDTSCSTKAKFQQFVHSYIDFAINNSNLYDLMFGRILWKNHGANEPLKKIAYQSFEHQVQMIQLWQQQGIISQDENALRLAQVV